MSVIHKLLKKKSKRTKPEVPSVSTGRDENRATQDVFRIGLRQTETDPLNDKVWRAILGIISACVVAVIVGMMFVIKAGVLSGSFYFQATAMFVAALIMAQTPDYAHFILGFVAWACFFFPGLKYYRQRKAGQATL